ncbi:MAG: autotransporter-associated beta strand repeat-containing protein, partial [Candidatus Omnitrophota bacterium]
AGTVTLSGVNTYTGATTINAGTLSVATIANGGVACNIGAATTAAGNLVLGGGTLQYTGVTASTDRNYTLTAATTSTIEIPDSVTFTISGASTNTTGALTKTGAGTLKLSGANLYTGTTTVSAGTLQYGANNALSSGAVAVSGGTLDLVTYTDTVGAVTLSSGSITSTTGILTGTSYAVQSGSISAILAGAVALTKTTAGTVTITGANTYTGLTAVSEGVLNIQNATATGTTAGGVSVADGAALQLEGGITVGAEALSLNGTGILNDGAIRNISGNNEWQGAVTLESSSFIGSDADTLILSGGITGVGAINIEKVGAGTISLTNTTNIGGNLTISAGILLANNTTINVGGSWSNSGTFTAGTSTVIFNDTTDNCTIATGNAAFNNLTISKTDSTDTVTVNSGTLTINGNLSITEGELALGTTSNFGNGAIDSFTVENGGSLLSSTPSLTFTFFAGSTLNIQNGGTITFNGQALGTKINLYSSDPGVTRWIYDLDAGAAQSHQYVNVVDSNASDQQGVATNSTGSNNINWSITGTGNTFSGTVYSDEGVTPIGAGRTIAIAVNGAAAAGTDDTDVNGIYTIASISIVAGDKIIVYINDEVGETGCTVSIVALDDLSGLDIYQDRVIVRYDYPAGIGYTTNIDLGTADNGDSDIKYAVAAGALTVEASNELFIWSGDTYRPSGSVTTPDFDIRGTVTADGNTFDISGAYSNTGVFTHGTSTVKLTGGTAVFTPGGIDEDHDFYNFEIDTITGGSTKTISGAIKANNIFTITNSVNVTADAITAASITQTASSGTTTFNGAVNTNAIAGIDLNGSTYA